MAEAGGLLSKIALGRLRALAESLPAVVWSPAQQQLAVALSNVRLQRWTAATSSSILQQLTAVADQFQITSRTITSLRNWQLPQLSPATASFWRSAIVQSRPALHPGTAGQTVSRLMPQAPLPHGAAQATCRGFASTAPQGHTESQEADNTPVIRFAKYLAMGMVMAIGLKVMPLMGQGSVVHAVALLEAEAPFMLRSGCARLALLAATQPGLQRALDAGAAPRLTGLLRPDTDPGVLEAALAVVRVMIQHEAGRHALAQAGAADALQQVITAEVLQDANAQILAAKLQLSLSSDPGG